MLSLLKSILAKKELAELRQWQLQWSEYRRWLGEFPMVVMVLDNMRSHVYGESLDACHPPASKGPWIVENLRYHLRRMVADAGKKESKYDDQWHAEFNKKHEQLTQAQQRIAELEGKLQSSMDLLLNTNTDLSDARLVCKEALDHLVTYSNSDRSILDKLSAVTRGCQPPNYPRV